MNSFDIANGIVFKKMNIQKESFEGERAKGFDERIICQKKVYLLQALGTDLGYSYNWYVRGPYSPALAHYVYNNIVALEDTNLDDYKVSETVEKNINAVNELEEQKTPDFTTESWYELLASLVYLDKNRTSWRIKGEDSDLYDALRKQKPQYSIEQCSEAYGVLKKRGFIDMGVKR